MPLAPWRSPIAHALHRNRSLAYARYLQVATVRSDGRPSNRTMVFRGFLEHTNHLRLISDRRSDKCTHLEMQPWAEACWYFPKTREQFRLLGLLTLIHADHSNPAWVNARQSMWQDLSAAARLQFVWPHPGKPRDESAPFNQLAPDPATPPPNFCLLLLDPHRVDHLELRGEPQNRTVYQFNPTVSPSDWSIQTVNP